jgi:outer membrane lipoprotein-sorting protein
MVGVPKLSRRARWAVPAGALVITGGVLAGSLMSVAQAAPGLPARTPAQLLAEASSSKTPALTGTVVETSSFGLPSLPGTGDDPTSLASLLTGSHTIKVWYADHDHFRLAAPESMSESDVIRDGSTAWLWDSTSNSVTEYSLSADKTATMPPQVQPLTPQQAAQQVLARVGKTTTVSVASNVSVAGQAAYELVLAPKDSRSLIGQVVIALDGSNGVPLRLQVFGRGASTPAFQIGYTSVQFVTPASAELTFTPPPGAKITRETMNGGETGASTGNAASDVTTTGSGWLTVLSVPSADFTPGKPPTKSGGPVSLNGGVGDSGAVLNTLLAAAAPVHGAWGSGRLLRTSLVSVLITDAGRAYIGAVQPSVLYAAASSAGKP